MMLVTIFAVLLLAGPLLRYSKPVQISDDSTVSGWHHEVSNIRTKETINNRFDTLAVSIMLDETPEENKHQIHASLTTYLRQVPYLQISNSRSADAFVGHKLVSSIPYYSRNLMKNVEKFTKIIEFPRLERYFDSFLSMLDFASKQEWFLQLDEGKLILK